MIHDFIIIRDGLPLLVKNYSDSQKIFSQGDHLLMISGFFSALNSFSDSFEDLGTISELKLSKNDLKLSFLKDKVIPNLIYLATFDDQSKFSSVQNLLKKISFNFLKKFDIKQISGWNGRIDSFNSFNPTVNQCIEEENGKNLLQLSEIGLESFKKEIIDIDEDFKPKKEKKELQVEDAQPRYFKFIPILKTKVRINPKNFLTGEMSCLIYNQIDSIKSINEISHNLEITQDQVYNICKNLIKMGLISFN
jgi:hypothetical protein